MITILSRIIHYGLQNFWRNGLLSTATVAIVTLCLIVFAGLVIANASTSSLISFLENKIDIAVYFKTNTPEDEILSVRTALQKLSEVSTADYISADQALEIFKNKHADEPAIAQSIAELNQNPLEASLNVKAKDPRNYADIANYLNAPDLKQYIDTVSYSKNQVVIDRLAAIIAGVNRIGLVLTTLLALIAGLVVFNTIRLVIYSNRDEIAIMRAVGASNQFVRGPYIMEGVIIGVLSSIISLCLIVLGLLVIPLAYNGAGSFNLSIPGFSLLGYFGSHFFYLLGYQILFGVGLTVVSSLIAVRRYLRN